MYTSLRDARAFPSFASCPHEGGIPHTYYREREDGIYRPSRHWCFLGEITESSALFRLQLSVQDKEGQTVPIWFHLDRDPPPIRSMILPTGGSGSAGLPDHRNLPHDLIDSGNTVAVLYAQRHPFFDSTIGLRIEDADAVQVRRIPESNSMGLTGVPPSSFLVIWRNCSVWATRFCVVTSNLRVIGFVTSVERQLHLSGAALAVTSPGIVAKYVRSRSVACNGKLMLRLGI
jgi:hypothetical protein